MQCMGGAKNHGIVLPDADPAKIAEGLFWGAFINNGQTCAALKRLYVHDSLYDEVCRRLTDYAANIRVGDGLDEASILGPVQNAMQFNKVRELVEDAKVHGGRILIGGEAPGGDGYFYPITLVADVDNGVRLVDEEQFGPVLPIIRYRDLDEVIRRANDNPAGLGGSVNLGSRTLTLGGLGNTSYSGTFAAGTGGLIKLGTGVQTLSGVNALSGGIALNAGGLLLGNAAALGGGTLSVGGNASLDGTTALALANAVNLGSGASLDLLGGQAVLGLVLVLAGELPGAAQHGFAQRITSRETDQGTGIDIAHAAQEVRTAEQGILVLADAAGTDIGAHTGVLAEGGAPADATGAQKPPARRADIEGQRRCRSILIAAAVARRHATTGGELEGPVVILGVGDRGGEQRQQGQAEQGGGTAKLGHGNSRQWEESSARIRRVLQGR